MILHDDDRTESCEWSSYLLDLTGTAIIKKIEPVSICDRKFATSKIFHNI